ncbi:hypothetical protein ACFYXD_34425 [Streptomyces platensis]|uniref:hypothetical protein n=1 Tax=Streptomyces platensis TaxID=58346 RepID=UPI0036B91FA8
MPKFPPRGVKNLPTLVRRWVKNLPTLVWRWVKDLPTSLRRRVKILVPALRGLARNLPVRVLLGVLALETLLFLGSAVFDMIRYPRLQVVSAALRIVIALLNGIACWRVSQELRKANRPPGRNSAGEAWRLPIVLIAQASSVPMLFIPLWVEIYSPIHIEFWDLLVSIVTLLLIVFAVCVIVRAFACDHISLSRTGTAAIALLPLAGVIQFWFMNFYQPTHDSPRVSVTSRLSELSHSGGVSHLRGEITLHNEGAAPVDILGAIYTVSGYRMRSAVGMRPDQVVQDLDGAKPNQTHLGKYRGLLTFDDVMQSGDILMPNQRWSKTFAFDVRGSKQDLARLVVHLSALTHTGDSDTSDKCEGNFTLGGDYPGKYRCTQTKLPSQSLMRMVLGDQPIARTVRYFPGKVKVKNKERTPSLYTRYQSADRQFTGTPKDFGKDPELEQEAEEIDSLVRDQNTESIAETRVSP